MKTYFAKYPSQKFQLTKLYLIFILQLPTTNINHHAINNFCILDHPVCDPHNNFVLVGIVPQNLWSSAKVQGLPPLYL